MPVSRQVLGPVVAGLSVWCAAGHLTVATAASPNLRFVAPQPFWVLLVIVVLCSLVPGWRRHPALATPALLATLPWWPLPLPAVALVWAGPLAWVPVVVALGLALTDQARVGTATGTANDRPQSLAAPVLAAALLTAGIAGLTAWAVAPRLPEGDEPHYLVITESLIKDGDLRIENNHTRRDYEAYWSGNLAPDYLRRGQNGEIYSIHAPGLPVLVLPAFLLAGYRGAQLTIILFAAVTGGVVWYLGWLATGRRGAAWFAWAAIAGSVTFLVQSVTVFPDGAGMPIVAMSVMLLFWLADSRRTVGRAWLLLWGGLLGAFPWLHSRFVILAVGFGVLGVAHLFRGRARAKAAWLVRTAWFLVLPALSAAAWFAFFWVIYGTPNPAAPYGGGADMRAAYVPGGVAGLLFDQQFGLMAYSPVLVGAFAALFARRGEGGGPRRDALTVGFGYLCVVSAYWMWFGGVPATPARLAAAVLPALAPALAVTWTQATSAGRVAWGLSLGASLAIAAVILFVDRAGLAWNVRGISAAWLDWLSPAVTLDRAWPSFFWRLTPGEVRTEVPFAVHLLLWAAVVLFGSVLIRLIGQRVRTPAGTRLSVAWTLLVLVMALVQAGWVLNGIHGLDPLRSQTEYLGRLADTPRAFAIAPLSIRPTTALASGIRLEVRQEDPEPETPRHWRPIEDLPAGTYRGTLAGDVGTETTVALRLGSATTPWKSIVVPPGSSPIFSFFLPAGFRQVAIEPPLSQPVSLTPVSLSAGRPMTARSVRYSGVDVYLADDHVFVEPDGFWVEGEQSAALVLAATDDQTTLTLSCANGGAANTVLVESGTSRFELSLRAYETREVAIALEADKAAVVRVRSMNGFRPSEVGSSADRRYLGVRVSVH